MTPSPAHVPKVPGTQTQATNALTSVSGTSSPVSGVLESNKCTNTIVTNFKIEPDLEKCTGNREYLKKLFDNQALLIDPDKVNDEKCKELSQNYFNNLQNTWKKCNNENKQTQDQQILTLKTYDKDKDYSIKKDDTFLIFDISETRMNAIKNIKFNCDNIDLQTITDFLNDYSMFNQNSLDSQIKIGEIIITKDMLQEKLENNLIKDVYIIKIIDIKDNEFTIEVSNLNNKSDKIKLIETLETLNKININDNDCFKIDYEITKPQTNLMGSMEEHYTKLDEQYDIYKKRFEQTKNESIKQQLEAKKILEESIEKIKNKLNLSITYKITETKLNELITYPGIGEVLVGNKNLLELIKKAMNKPIENSMIFKLYKIDKEKDKKNLYYGDYITTFTPYSYRNTYLLLSLVLSNKRYRTNQI